MTTSALSNRFGYPYRGTGNPSPTALFGRVPKKGGQIARATSLFGRVPKAGRETRPLRQDRRASTNPGCAVGAADPSGPFKPIRSSVPRDVEPVPYGVIRTCTEGGTGNPSPTALFVHIPNAGAQCAPLRRCSGIYRARDGGPVPYGRIAAPRQIPDAP